MKKYEITELMRDYTDDEFNIEGENAADSDRVVENVLGQVIHKKKAKPLFKVLAAAAAAVCLMGGTVAAASLLISGHFTTAAGNDITFEIHENGWSGTGTMKGFDTLVTSAEGRLYFNLNGESTDITDITDRKTPYIYSYTIAETGEPAYIIAGGTPEDYGVVDMYYIEGTGWEGHGAVNGDTAGSAVRVTVDEPGEQYLYNGWYSTNLDFLIVYDTFVEKDNEIITSNRHWHGSAIDILPTWHDDRDAWLIEALVKLELIELPDIANFKAPEIYINGEGRLIEISGNNEIDVTDKISEDTPYIITSVRSDDRDCYIIAGGTPENCGWAVIIRYGDEYWTIGSENITDADGQLREWYLNAVEKKGCDLEQLQQNYFFSFE